MPPEIKFCGLTRPADAAVAAQLGAGYVGVVLTESPRRLSAELAGSVYAAARSGGLAVQTVAVFGSEPPELIGESARRAGATVVQLHGDPTAATVRQVRAVFDGAIWAVVRLGAAVAVVDSELVAAADAIVLDTLHPRLLGGTGAGFDWDVAAETLHTTGRAQKLVLAGGLGPSIVGAAIRRLQPDVVDVSSGVESSPGIKDHALMRAFAEAVAQSDRQ